jgi:transcriptional regulator with XRE-family HTH domain
MTPREMSVKWVKKLMEREGINQTKLAARMGVHPNAVSRILSKRFTMKVTTLFRCIEACEYEIVELRVKKKG